MISDQDALDCYFIYDKNVIDNGQQLVVDSVSIANDMVVKRALITNH